MVRTASEVAGRSAGLRASGPGGRPLVKGLQHAGGRIRPGLLALLAAVLPSLSSAFTVFACEPEWAALTRVLLPTARLHVATHAGQDPHHIEARPALIAQVRNADLVACTGASLESGWLPTLQERAGNPKAREVFFAAASSAANSSSVIRLSLTSPSQTWPRTRRGPRRRCRRG